MQQRGRKSAAALAVVEDGQTGMMSVMVPPMLSPAERSVWLMTVNSKPNDYFGSEHIPILTEYARQVCWADVLDAEIKRFDPAWLAEEEGLKRYTKLVDLALRVSNSIGRTAQLMRLTHKDCYRAEKVVPKSGRKLWQRAAD